MLIKKILWELLYLVYKFCYFRNKTIKVLNIKNFPKAPFIVAASHRHAWDGPLGWFVTYQYLRKPIHYFVNKQLFTGLGKYFFLIYEHIPVQSGLKSVNKKALKTSSELLSSKHIIAITPYPYDLQKKKYVIYMGIVKLLQQNNVPYVPVNIAVKEKWKSRSYYDRNFDYVRINIGMPQKNILYRKKLTKMESIQYTKGVMNKIARLQG